MELYSVIVTKGQYLIVEDTAGEAGRAKDAFLIKNKKFKIDVIPERFVLTQNPGGFFNQKGGLI